MSNCRVGPLQEPASAIPGNIGIIRAKLNVWEHDPLQGRPFQQTGYPFTDAASEQMREVSNNAEFQANSVFLKPIYEIHDTWLASIKPTGLKEGLNTPDPADDREIFALDFVKPKSDAAKARMVGGVIYNRNGKPPDDGTAIGDDTTGRDIFPHQTWIHVGSLLKKAVPQHPSEYELPTSSVLNYQNLIAKRNVPANKQEWFQKFTLAELQNCPKWEMREIVEGSTGKQAFWPTMIGKRTSEPVHWSIEKLTPVWQGQDFFVTVVLGDQDVNDAIEKDQNDLVDSDTQLYKYLIYDPTEKPTIAGAGEWVKGISNEAFYIAPDPNPQPSVDPQKEAAKAARKIFWWRFKSYILIEIGHGDPDNNYFIELVKGRNPRFLHLGDEWDNRKRIEGGGILSPDDFLYIKKSRVLSEYGNVSVNEIFKKKEFRITLRNHLGRFIITFEGYEGSPWIISRLDNDPSRYDYNKLPIPMVVPAGKMRIHGGNISCSVGYAPLRYSPTCTIRYNDRQADSAEITDQELFMTFANLGNSEKHKNESIKTRFYRNPKFKYRKIGYDLDAYEVDEIIENASVTVPVYQLYSDQYRKTGKGWVQSTTQPPAVGTETIGFPLPNIAGLLSSGLKVPHTASIVNLREPGRKFIFGLQEETNSSYPFKEYVSKWDVGVVLKAGSVEMPDFRETSTLGPLFSEKKLFKDYVTPIVTNWSLIILGGAKPFEGKIEPFDIAPLVVSLNDSWSSEAFTTINHEMQVRCYIPDSVLPPLVNPPVQIEPNIFALGQKLLSLHDKNFYITVSYWWDNGVGERDAPDNIIQRTAHPAESDLLIQMTGFAEGASLEKSVNKLYMDFTIKDYSAILEDQFIYNSPFFDGVADSVAIYELARLAHFDDNDEKESGIDRRPLGYLQKVITEPNYSQCRSFRYNGEECIYRDYDLPGSYSDLANPSVRFQNGETYWSAMQKIAALATKVIYFDRWGVLRFENSPAIEAAFNSGERQKFTPKFQFVTTPFKVASAGEEGDAASERFIFDPNLHASHFVWEVVKYSRSVEDCVNQIILFTASNDILVDDGRRTGGFIVEGYTFFDQIFNPAAEGFIGYRKPFYQSNGVFGGIEGVRIGLQHYAKMKYPPALISFQTYTVPGLKPLDIITVDDQMFYITEIANEIDPENNKGWCTISGEWLKSYTGSLGFLEERGRTDSDSTVDAEDVIQI